MFKSRDMGRAIAVKRWTPTALECYTRGCVCDGCFYRLRVYAFTPPNVLPFHCTTFQSIFKGGLF